MGSGSNREPAVLAGTDITVVYALIAACILLSAISGFSVAVIIKKLDNIVKLYTQALSNMATSIACAVFFPDHFRINVQFVACFATVFAAIVLYERNKPLLDDLGSIWTDVLCVCLPSKKLVAVLTLALGGLIAGLSCTYDY